MPTRADGPLHEQFRRERAELLASFGLAAQVVQFPECSFEEPLQQPDPLLSERQSALVIKLGGVLPADLHTGHRLKSVLFFNEIIRDAHSATFSRLWTQVKSLYRERPIAKRPSPKSSDSPAGTGTGKTE